MIAVLTFMGGWLVMMNYACIIVWYTQRRHSSTSPLLGGLFLAGAMLLCPLAGVRAFAWLPFVLDTGCLYLLVACVYWFGIKKIHKP